ncbi:transcription initiation factor TFIID subunit 13-like [Corticium candelabrum]|uniref:transcription initiation factor TFIID subunit 13-like n=1 Tax=Corticium candelabrum TaxID=121492 RepID=UPI002E270C10|nr:transcription initiation factor TFIID subunit 13-like [Corticium candelabrum]
MADDDSDREDASSQEPQAKRKRLFTKELRCMMYGFGDDSSPYTESVDLLEDLVVDYVTAMTLKALTIGKKGRVHVEDIVFLVRKDAKKYGRVKELLMMNEELKKARKAFDHDNLIKETAEER